MSARFHPSQLRLGDLVAEFRVIRRLATGGFSIVLLVMREGRLYTLKMATQPAGPEDLDRVDDRMRREVVSLGHFAHPNLLPVHAMGRWPHPEQGYSYYVTDYIRGATFHAWRWKHRISLHGSVVMLGELLRVLEVLHERGLCHRDLKADNVLIRQDGKLFLIDLGSVHLPCAYPLTQGVAPGTLYCQPPEVVEFVLREAWKGSTFQARPSADLYGVGVLLYELLTNRYPFNPKLPLPQLLMAIASSPPVAPGELVPGLPASLADLPMRLLAKDPTQRPPSVRAVREELERLLAEEGNTEAWQALAECPSRLAARMGPFPQVEVLEVKEEEADPPASSPTPSPEEPGERGKREGGKPGGTLALTLALILSLGLLGIGWGLFLVGYLPRASESMSHAEPPSSVQPTPSEKGTPPMSSLQNAESSARADSLWAPSARCQLLRALLGGLVASNLVACATTPTAPAIPFDHEAFLAGCSEEARTTPLELRFHNVPHETHLETYVDLGPNPRLAAISVKPGPIEASMYVFVGKDMTRQTKFRVAGKMMTTERRAYFQFDRIRLPDGSWRPICGVGIDIYDQYGMQRYNSQPGGPVVDAKLLENHPGGMVLAGTRINTIVQWGEGQPLPPARVPPPDWR